MLFSNVNLSEYLELLKSQKVPHYIVCTSSSIEVELDMEEIEIPGYKIQRRMVFKDLDNLMDPITLGCINQVRQAVEQSGVKAPHIDRGRISYYSYNNASTMAGSIWWDQMEVDLNEAYWRTAHKLGYLPNWLFEAGLGWEKMNRLVSQSRSYGDLYAFQISALSSYD